MSLRVYNAPDVERIQMVDVFKTSGVNRERNFNPGYSYESFLGTDALKLSPDYGGKTSSRGHGSSYSYANLIRLSAIIIVIMALIISGLSVLVNLGGLISLVVAALVLFFSVFLYSINLNPFNKETYKKVLAYLV